MCRTKMAWDTRPSGSYYYQSVRVGPRVTRRYFGTGPLAELAAEMLAERRKKRGEVVQNSKALRTYLTELDALMGRYTQLVDLITSGIMLPAGYHRPRYRTTWRKRYGRRKAAG
jgi:hypothetical protein